MKDFILKTAVFFLPMLPWSSIAEEQVYLTKDQALKLIFGEDCTPQYSPQTITESISEKLDDQGLLNEDQERAHFFECRPESSGVKYALIDAEVGKHMPMTYIVGLSETGQITQIHLMVYRETIGWEVKERGFLDQFNSKSQDDRLVVGRTIKNISGATLSSQAIAKGSRRALALWHEFYGKSLKDAASDDLVEGEAP